MVDRVKVISLLLVVGFIVTGTGILAASVFKPPALDDGSRDRNIIIKLQQEGYVFVLPKEYFAGTHYPKTALLIHDADFDVQGAAVFTEIERSLGVKSAFYLRPDAEWYTQNIAYFQGLERQGWEIGFQYDCLSRSNGNRTLAMDLFKAQLSYMREFFNVTTTDYHGDNYNLTIFNYDLYNKQEWNSMELNEVYSLNYSYVTDSNNIYLEPKTFTALVIVQLHTDWTKQP
jgi:hypothetical protein